MTRTVIGLIAAASVAIAVVSTVKRTRSAGESGQLSSVSSAPDVPAIVAASTPKPYVGVILSERTVDIVSRHEGVILALPAKLGDRVQVNDVIAQIDAPKLRLELATATAAIQTATVDQDRAKLEVVETLRQLKYEERLQGEGLSGKEAVEKARFAHELATLRVAEVRAKLTERRSRVDELRAELDATTVRSSFAGIVATRYLDRGAHVQVSARLVRIVADGNPIVRFAIPQVDVALIHAGLEVLATSVASGVKVHGRVTAISPEVDLAANMLFVEADVLAADRASPWRSGEVVHVTVPQAH